MSKVTHIHSNNVFRNVGEVYEETINLDGLGNIAVHTLNHGEYYNHLRKEASMFLIVMYGTIKVYMQGKARIVLERGECIEINQDCVLESLGSGLIISTEYYKGLFRATLELPMEGHLRFIDGCTDTVLLPSIVKGMPCLNFLYVPKYTTQAKHTHPSIRIGLVYSGVGECIVNDDCHKLLPGVFFIVHQDTIHQFLTTDNDLRIFVFHPDSDFGPSDEEHPMINKSLIDGDSVTNLRRISGSI